MHGALARTLPPLLPSKKQRSNIYEARFTNERANTMISTAQLKTERQFAGPAEHLIASIRGSLPGPTLIILGGIHGNEPAGVLAAERVWLRMQKRRAALHGEVVLLRGNTRAPNILTRVSTLPTDRLSLLASPESGTRAEQLRSSAPRCRRMSTGRSR